MRQYVRVVCSAVMALLTAWSTIACATAPRTEDEFADARRSMVEHQLKARDISDIRVLEAMLALPRHRFMPMNQEYAYDDGPAPIGLGQTISQPYIVAFMTQALNVQPADVVLEIGTGSGYQAAVLSKLARHVYTIEIVKELADWARQALVENGCSNVRVKHGDGFYGWPDKGPFDKIMITAAAGAVPQPLQEQLKEGGVLLMPYKVSSMYESLARFTKRDGALVRQDLLDVRFVPMTGEVQKQTVH